jgi:hypothetical protein
MAFSIPNTASTDLFVSFGGGLYVGGWITVIDQTGVTGGGGIDVFINHSPGGGQSAQEQGQIVQFTAGTYPLIGTPADPVRSISVRSHVAGKPAQFFGLLVEENKSGFGAGVQVVGTLSASGGFTPPAANVVGGVATLTWPGGSNQSTSLLVTHGLGSSPTAVVATAAATAGIAGGAPTLDALLYTVTNFTLIGYTNDGSLPAAGSTAQVGWIALA